LLQQRRLICNKLINILIIRNQNIKFKNQFNKLKLNRIKAELIDQGKESMSQENLQKKQELINNMKNDFDSVLDIIISNNLNSCKIFL